MTHNPKPTDAQMKLARECAAKACGEPQRVAILDGQFDRTPGVKSALLAIQATEARMAQTVEAERERCAMIAETMKHPWRDTIRQTDIGPMKTKIRLHVTPKDIAAAIRSNTNE